MTISNHAKDVAASIIAKQSMVVPQQVIINKSSLTKTVRKKTKTVGPDTQIRVAVNMPATIISESSSGCIEEFVVISPTSSFSVFIQSNNKRVKLDKTWTELSAISAQAHDIAAFRDADGNYILNINKYRWQEDMMLVLRSTSGSFLFSQVYANWYIYGEE